MFIGIAINIFTDTAGSGGGGTSFPSLQFDHAGNSQYMVFMMGGI